MNRHRSHRRPAVAVPDRRMPQVLSVLLMLSVLSAAAAWGQISPEVAESLPQVITEPESLVDHIAEFGLSLGRYDFDGSDETSGFDGQFLRYSRSRPGLDTWRIDVGRQGRFGTSSLDAGLGYTRIVNRTSLSAGISGGTSDVLSNEYRFDLGVAHPIADFQTSLGYTRAQSHGENSSHGWSLGVTRWFPHLILGAGYRIDYGQPGDTESSTLNFGATYYVWRKTYLGAGVSFGEVSYQLVGPGTPLSSQVLVDYEAWSANLALTRFVTDHSGFNLRYEHSRAKDIWTVGGLTASYFREW